MKNGLVIFIYLLVAAADSNAQPYYFKHYEVENGLSNNTVLCSVVDKKGFLWVGTKDGLNRFDGYTFKVFRHKPGDSTSLGGNFIQSIHEDTNGLLWVGTDKGIYTYDACKENFTALHHVRPGLVKDIQMDDNGFVWYISGPSLVKFHPSHGYKVYKHAAGFEPTSCTAADGSLWVSTAAGTIQEYETQSDSCSNFDLFKHAASTDPKYIQSVFYTGKGSLLVGTTNYGVKLFDITTASYQDILTYNKDHSAILVRDFIQSSQDEYWIATETGLFMYNAATKNIIRIQKQYNNPFSLSDNSIYTFCKDREGGIWVGTYFGGLNYYSKTYTNFEKIFPMPGEPSLSGNVISTICTDKYDNLWIGTEDAGLNKLQLKKDRPVAEAKIQNIKLPRINIHGLLASGDTLWIGTFKTGLYLMDVKTNKLIGHYSIGSSPGSLRSDYIHSIYKTSSGAILLATSKGLYQWNQQNKSFDHSPFFPDALFYRTVFEDSYGTIWAGTNREGLYHYNSRTGVKGRFVHIPQDSRSLGSNRVNCVFEDSDRRLWFATEGGICRFDFDRNNFMCYTTESGLLSNLTFEIREDAQKCLWISSSKGLVRLDPATAALKVYTKANGLLSDQFNYNSSFKDGSGNLYFGSVKGLIRYNPMKFINSNFIAPVFLTGFQVNNKELSIDQSKSSLLQSISITDTISLDHNQSSFSIDFAALSYISPQSTTYSYKLEGLNKEWSAFTSDRKATFTDLSPGVYTFHVKAANGNGLAGNDSKTLLIRIQPPFWSTTVAYICYTLIVCLLAYYMVRRYHLAAEAKHRRKLELLERDMEKETYHAKIEFFTNIAHEIRTPLTLIKGPMEDIISEVDKVPHVKNKLMIMERNTNRLLNLTNQLLDFRKTEIKGFSLNFVRASVNEILQANYTSFEMAAAEKKLQFQLDMPPECCTAYVDREALNKIISNLISNAINYAASAVEIKLLPPCKENGCFTVTVSNDGFIILPEFKTRIFETFFRIKETTGRPGTGIGLSLARSLTELHKGILYLEEPAGSKNTFVLSLPIHQEIEFDPI